LYYTSGSKILKILVAGLGIAPRLPAYGTGDLLLVHPAKRYFILVFG